VLSWKPKVLVLDEDLLALELYSRELGENYQIVTSEGVEEARQYLKDTLFDALIMEPAVNNDEGWSLLSEIRSSPHPPPVILCSIEDDRKIGLEQGAQAFVVKPVLPTALHALLDQIVERRSTITTHKLEKGI
jgi:DNA-binding response OmpR family regulator